MNLQNQLFMVVGMIALIFTGTFTTLFIVSSPRSIDYSMQKVNTPVPRNELAEYFSNSTVTYKIWYDVLMDFSIIQTLDDIDSSNDNIQFFTDIDMDTQITDLQQLGPNIVSTRDYVNFQNSEEQHVFYFAESEQANVQYVISAYNNNLRNRQTAVCAFYMHNEVLKGYVLNNLILRAVQTSEIVLLLDEPVEFVKIIDFDGNSYEFTMENV
ncbi:hypothetical protein NEAUS04_1528 [Nematocida ausubeli]|uniref:Uncharacterized protein n=1 Tax=Nematocida ausubeli (strain ATCC PRA-371 / ERTm2) TaxID=1913371 RepID=H8ZBL1_NEMA1|nr:uncharacterized protein NESG_01189 [Nematocida ausubeli]EHY66264.1 hypothetical protein NERG_00960 [Nematocida ausubeli]KAI5135378.1 hypothetical protein NEAUS07_1117 [Nematocida ausubeli]KAI5148191.1 hypothetical protein NEAUS05_1293 [Nematocida ausubeli]KAI5163396.1 hypothetical protein NEAUS04_1528 [Nematocida ausubeli]KFG26075.1 hypothetical protein NESG_01189 [Nematocida ausubeli]